MEWKECVTLGWLEWWIRASHGRDGMTFEMQEIPDCRTPSTFRSHSVRTQHLSFGLVKDGFCHLELRQDVLLKTNLPCAN